MGALSEVSRNRSAVWTPTIGENLNFADDSLADRLNEFVGRLFIPIADFFGNDEFGIAVDSQESIGIAVFG